MYLNVWILWSSYNLFYHLEIFPCDSPSRHVNARYLNIFLLITDITSPKMNNVQYISVNHVHVCTPCASKSQLVLRKYLFTMIFCLKKKSFQCNYYKLLVLPTELCIEHIKMILYDEWKGNIPLLYIVSDIDVV